MIIQIYTIVFIETLNLAHKHLILVRISQTSFLSQTRSSILLYSTYYSPTMAK